MDLLEAITTRRTVFNFKPDAVDPELIEQGIDAARWAPNHKLTEPWRFYVAGPETRGRIGAVAARLAASKAPATTPPDRLADIQAKARAKIADLPALVVVSVCTTGADDLRRKEDYAAAACAIQNMQLALWANGLGAQWGTGAPTRDPETYAIVGIDAAAEEIVGFLKVGYPAEIPTSRRKSVSEVRRVLP